MLNQINLPSKKYYGSGIKKYLTETNCMKDPPLIGGFFNYTPSDPPPSSRQ
jgi:hypothetical protein